MEILFLQGEKLRKKLRKKENDHGGASGLNLPEQKTGSNPSETFRQAKPETCEAPNRDS